MSRAKKALVVLVLATLGLWGCAQEKSHGTGSARIKSLESKNARLEEDYQAVVAARDKLRKKLISAEEQQNRLTQQLEESQAVAKERDELRQQVNARISERDALQTQFDQFRKGIRTLLGQADTAALTVPGQPVATAAATRSEGKS
jgi:septal ring factor EnvC (AmiA/AmiB activator)